MSTSTGTIPIVQAVRPVPTTARSGSTAAPSRTALPRALALPHTPARPQALPLPHAPARPQAPALPHASGRPQASARPKAPARRDPLRIAAQFSPLLGLGLSIGLIWWGLQAGVLQSLENLQAFIDSLGAWGPIVFLVVSVASVVFPIVPGGLLVLAGPVLFGAVEGTVLNYVAVSDGSMLNFLIARHVGLSLIERLFRPRTVEKFLGWTRSPHFTRAFATAIALPVAPDDLLCYIAGTTRMRWRTYVWIILLCKPWALIAYGLGVSALVMHLLPW